MTKEETVDELQRKGFVVENEAGGFGCPDGTNEPRLRHRDHGTTPGGPGSVYVCCDRLCATGRYTEQFQLLRASSGIHNNYPTWSGVSLRDLLELLHE